MKDYLFIIRQLQLMLFVFSVAVITPDKSRADTGFVSISDVDKSSVNAVNDRWYITLNGKSVGPLDKEIIEQYIQNGTVTRYTMVMREGETIWKFAKKMFDFTNVPQQRWFVMQNTLISGPFTEDELVKKIDNGVIVLDARIRKDGSDTWVNATNVFKFPRSAYLRHERAQQQKRANQSRSTSVPATYNEALLREKAQHVRAGNILAGIGMLGSAAGFGIQISAISNEDADLFNRALIISLGFGILRFSGVVTSGVAATRYTRETGDKPFSWGLFWGGYIVGLAGNTVVIAGSGNGDISREFIMGAAVASQVILTLAWIGHCASAARATEKHRGAGTQKKRGYALAPIFSPHTKTWGIAFTMFQ